MKQKAKLPAGEANHGPACVCFEFVNPAAQSVAVAGSFNDWHAAAAPMISVGNGKWRKELTLPPGRYEYRFVVDGEWTDDPSATEFVPNPHGSRNAVRTIPASTKTEADS